MNLIEQAKKLAIQHHADQKYDEHPYSYHLYYVSNILTKFNYADDELIMAAGWLHDVLENTDLTYETLVSEFGKEVSDIVWAVTTEPGQNRAERLRNTSPKIHSHPKALIIKLADKIANTEYYLNNNPRHYKIYIKEFPLFKIHLYNPDAVDLLPMWEQLIQLSSPT